MPTNISVEDFVEAIYAGVLGRSPDEAGRAHHLTQLGTDPTASQLASMVAGAVQSAEALQRRPPPSRTIDLTKLQAASSDGRLQVVSIGRHCITASLIQSMGLRTASYPFDWLFSNFALVRECIESDFATFLDQNEYEHIPITERVNPREGYAHHRFYREAFGGPPVFNHHDMSLDRNYEHFKRAVNRFQALRSSNTSVIYFGIAHQFSHDLGELARISSRLVRKGLDAVIVLEVNDSPPQNPSDVGAFSVREEADGLFLVPYRARSLMGGTAFGDPVDDDLLRILLSRLFANVTDSLACGVGV